MKWLKRLVTLGISLTLMATPVLVAAETTSQTASTTSEPTSETKTTSGSASSTSTQATSESKTASSQEATTEATKTSETTEATKETKATKATTESSKRPKSETSTDKVNYFNSADLYSYPLGVGSEFTAFAGKTLSIGRQDTTGFMGGNQINSQTSNWPVMFDPNLDGGLALMDNPQNERVTLVANGINDNLANLLKQKTNFNGQKIIVPNPPTGLSDDQHSSYSADNLKSFQENGIAAKDWTQDTESNLATISQQYQSLTGEGELASSNSKVGLSKTGATSESKAKYVHTLTIDNTTVTDLSQTVLIFKLNLQNNNDQVVLNFTNGVPDKLPFIILNWQNSGAIDWNYNTEFNVQIKEENGELINSQILDEQSERIIHNFTQASSVVVNGPQLFGSILVPHGDITMSSAGENLIHSSYVAGGNITVDSPLHIDTAIDNHFDYGNWPGKVPPATAEKRSIQLLKSDGSDPGETLQVVKGQKTALNVKVSPTTQIEIEYAFDEGKFTTMKSSDPIDLSKLSVGEHHLTVRFPGDSSIEDQITITVTGFLTLDAVPDLNFGQKQLNAYSQDRTFGLISGQVEGTTADGNQNLETKITDERSTKSLPWELSVALSPFQSTTNSAAQVNAEIQLVSDAINTTDGTDSQGIVEGTVASGGNLVIAGEGSLNEKLSTKTKLTVTDSAIPETGTYQGTVTWTLANAPQ